MAPKNPVWYELSEIANVSALHRFCKVARKNEWLVNSHDEVLSKARPYMRFKSISLSFVNVVFHVPMVLVTIRGNPWQPVT